jgi:hypothetical protein
MTSLPAEYFATLYEQQDDPWGFATRWYEERKRSVSLAALPEARYDAAFEPGCSIGMLTEGLAPRCGSLLATDVAEAALQQARRRLKDYPSVRFERRAVPDEWPDGEFDLIVISELGYYFEVQSLGRLLDRVEGSLRPQGTLLAVHWRHPVADYPLTGDAVHERIAQRDALCRTVSHLEEDFVLEVYLKAPAGAPSQSVAARSGLIP